LFHFNNYTCRKRESVNNNIHSNLSNPSNHSSKFKSFIHWKVRTQLNIPNKIILPKLIEDNNNIV
jgi:hypothetical protein